MSDDLLVRLLQIQHQNAQAVEAVEAVFSTEGFLNVDVLGVVIAAMDAAPDHIDVSYGDHFDRTVVDGTEAECRAFLAWVRQRSAEDRRLESAA